MHMEEKTWEEFRTSGMLWWINRILHTFGWAIVIEYDGNPAVEVRAYPARVDYRGFSRDDEEKGYQNVSTFLKTDKAMRDPPAQ